VRNHSLVTPDLDPCAATRPTPVLTTQLKPLILLGDETLDRDHRGILERIQAVIDSDNVALPTLLRTLLVHIEQHFDRENELMGKYRYRGLRDHKAEHDLLLREFQRCVERVDDGSPGVGRMFVVERLVPWFEVHVPSMDCVLVLHVQKQLETLR
jgi:hemerythrin-like metal-binding protein